MTIRLPINKIFASRKMATDRNQLIIDRNQLIIDRNQLTTDNLEFLILGVLRLLIFPLYQAASARSEK